MARVSDRADKRHEIHRETRRHVAGRHAANASHDRRRFGDPRRLVSLPPMRYGRKKGRVGLDKQTVLWNKGGQVAHVARAWERQDARNRDVETEIERATSLV